MSPHSDEALVDSYRHGDYSALEKLIKRYLNRVVWLAQKLLGDKQEALDVGQEVFLAASTGLKTWRGDAAFFTWLYRTTYQICSVRLRKRVPIPLARLPDKAAKTPEADDARKAEVAEALAEAVGKLPERRKQVFLLRHEEALPLAEIASRLGISLGATKSHLHHALADLRAEMKKRGIL